MTTFTFGQQDKIRQIISSEATSQHIQNDPWALAKSIVDNVQADANFVVANNHAYSIVFGQDVGNTAFYGRMCMVDNNYLFGVALFDFIKEQG